MFGINWNDPQTLWLNYTNFGLGLVVLACIGVALYAFAAEIAVRLRKTAPDVESSVRDFVSSAHTFHSPELGLTMADGGEPEDHKPQPKPRKK